jgi:hypothetical protein
MNCPRLAPDLSRPWLTRPASPAHAAERLPAHEPARDPADGDSTDWQSAWIDFGGEG